MVRGIDNEGNVERLGIRREAVRDAINDLRPGVLAPRFFVALDRFDFAALQEHVSGIPAERLRLVDGAEESVAKGGQVPSGMSLIALRSVVLRAGQQNR